MPYVETKELRMHYQFDGPSDAPPLVLSNSLGTTIALWEPQMSVFAKNFRVLRYDSRGHGDTAVTPREYSIERLANDVIQLLDALRLHRVYFCGLSIGGMTGMWLGANAPKRLNKLVVCNTGAKLGNAESWNARIQAVRSGGTQSVAGSVIARWFTPEFREKEPEKVAKARQMIERTNAVGYMSSCAAVRDFDFRQKLGAIQVPTLIVSGAHDPVATPADGHALSAGISGAQYTELNAAHISNIEDADRFNSEVSTFLMAEAGGALHG